MKMWPDDSQVLDEDLRVIRHSGMKMWRDEGEVLDEDVVR